MVLWGDGAGSNIALRYCVRTWAEYCVLMRPAGGSALDARASDRCTWAVAVRCVSVCVQFRQDARVLGAVLINCNAGTAGFFESYSDRVRTRKVHTAAARTSLAPYSFSLSLPTRRPRCPPQLTAE